MGELKMEDMIHKFTSLTDKPVKYLTIQNDLKEDIKNLVKSLYDYTKSQEDDTSRKKGALSEIIVQDFDEEQIWQQIELQNTGCWDELVWDVANCISSNNDLNFPVKIAQSQEENFSEGNSEVSNMEEVPKKSKEDKEISQPKKKKETKPKTKSKTSIVDDEFFNLQDMEKFLISEEKMEGKGSQKKNDSDEESIDMFEDIDDEASDEEEGETKDAMYSDFFDGENRHGVDSSMEDEDIDMNEEAYDDSKNVSSFEPKKKDKRVRFANQESDESNTDNARNIANNLFKNEHAESEKKSDFEMRQQRLSQQISKLEEKSLTEAPWQLKGEVDATKRPQNSLLEEVVDFDLTTRPVPVITEQTTLTLEEIVKRRIKDKAWDDVVKKEKPIDDQLVFRKPEILDHNKSKQSLAQVYETEYLKQKQALSGGDEEEKEPESHTEIRDLMGKLFAKLDALCHYHYTPKAPQAEVKIISNTPAISMEEVAPVATSHAALLAPEEVKKKQRGDLMSKAERTQTDKNRERRKKKKLQRQKGKVMKVTEHRNTTQGVETTDKALKTSKAFFQQLNDDATSLIKSKTKRNVKNKGQ